MRTEPIRNFSNAFRSAEPWEDSDRYGPGDPCGPGPAGPAGGDRAEGDRAGSDRSRPSWSDVVSRGVDLGYQVIEEQIRQGQRAARDLNDRPYDVGRMSDDLWEATERAFRYYSEMTGLWMQFLTSMSWMGPAAGAWTRPWGRPQPQERGPEPEPRPAESGWRRVAAALEVDSQRPVSVELDLHTPGDADLLLGTLGLHSLEGHKPLTDITFEPGAVRDGVRLRLRIADDQPAGFYSGAVFDQRTGRPQGTLSVRISERTA